jgi:hypothetical protein
MPYLISIVAREGSPDRHFFVLLGFGKELDMNGCNYCVIIHNRKRRGKKLARGVAMCLAQREMTRCEQKSDERGPGCLWHDAKIYSQSRHTFEPHHAATVSG